MRGWQEKARTRPQGLPLGFFRLKEVVVLQKVYNGLGASSVEFHRIEELKGVVSTNGHLVLVLLGRLVAFVAFSDLHRKKITPRPPVRRELAHLCIPLQIQRWSY